MVMQSLCAPALIYLVFSITQVSIDTVKGMYNLALVKIWVAFLFTILLNYLCSSGLGVISWIIVFVPFILMTVIVTMLLVMFGLDPSSGKLLIPNEKKQHDKKHHVNRHLTETERRAVEVAEDLETNIPRHHNRAPDAYSFPSKSKMSKAEKRVLNDMKEKRA
jgi:hypothetical protein